MSTEQRLRAYYNRYVRSYYGNRPKLFLRMARLFKMPVKDIKDILGIERKPPYPTPTPYSCVEEASGNCLGVVHWCRSWRDDPFWEGRCAVHHPNWEFYAETYGDRYWDMIEERHAKGR